MDLVFWALKSFQGQSEKTMVYNRDKYVEKNQEEVGALVLES